MGVATLLRAEAEEAEARFAERREVFRQNVSQPVGKMIDKINPILRGWVNYFEWGIRTDVSPWSSTAWKRRSGSI